MIPSLSPARRFPFFVPLALLLASETALAQSPSSDAERLFSEGREAMQKREYDLACQKFAESNRADAALGTELNLANCEEQRSHLGTAWTLYRRVREQLPPGDRRIQVADERIAAIEPRLSFLRFDFAPNTSREVRVRIDAEEFDASALRTPRMVDAGSHEVAFLVAGHPEQTSVVTLKESETLDVKAPPAATTANAEPTRDNGAPTEEAGPNRTAAYLAGGIGLASLIVGTATGLAGLHQESVGNANCSDATRTCNQKGVDANSAARALATVSTITFAVGVAGVGVGGYLYLTASPPKTMARPAQGQMFSLAWRGTW